MRNKSIARTTRRSCRSVGGIPNVVSKHELITTRGRWLPNVEVSFERGEFKVSWVRLDPDEDAAVLIDRARNCAYISKPFRECQLLAALHGYELALLREDGESFLEHIEKFLASL